MAKALTKPQKKLLARAAKSETGAHLSGSDWTVARKLEELGLMEGRQLAIGRRFITEAGRAALEEKP